MTEKTTAEDYLLELAAFMVMSARGVIDEGFMYGPFRLVDAVSRLAELPEYADCIKEDKFLAEVKKEIDGNKNTLMESEQRFTDFLDGLAVKIARELKRRALKED
jgi:hypothetical protein